MGQDCTEDFLVMTLKGIEYTANKLQFISLFLTFYKPLNLWIAFSCSKVANFE